MTRTLLLLAAAACSEPPAPPPPSGALTFVRDGVVTPGVGSAGQPLPDGRTLLDRRWSPGQAVVFDGLHATAPAVPECVELVRVAVPEATPETRLAVRGDDVLLALPDETVRVVDGWRGRIRPDSGPLPEGLPFQAGLKGITADGTTLVVDGARCSLPAPPATAFVADDLRVVALTRATVPQLLVLR